MKQSPISLGFFVLISTTLIVVMNNQALFTQLIKRLDITSLQGAGYVITIYLVIIALVSLVVLMIPGRFLVKTALVFLAIISSILSYFNSKLGVVIDVEMLRNTVEAIKDNNQQEARELLSFPLIKHIFIYGIVPAVIIAWIRIRPASSLMKHLIGRIAYLVGIIVVVAVFLMMNYKYVAFFSRENRDLRVYMTPSYTLGSTVKYFSNTYKAASTPFTVLGEDAQKPPKQRPTLGIMVVGETARADHYTFNGYARNTNPKLAREDGVINFSQVSSCGTSTAYSVPCMFSFMAKKDYKPEKAMKQSNALDVLKQSGVRVLWIDNNSSCKGVCNRIESTNLHNNPDPHHPLFSDGGYYDQIMLETLNNNVKLGDEDSLLVLHILGSHGPTYHKRYPDDFAVFKPDCFQDTPQACSDEEVINAYDNTILYTDHILAELINWLKQQSHYETFMLYVSDHGESLGENGVYLHGLPYFLAPQAQIHVPMLAWFSESYKNQYSDYINAVAEKNDKPLSHDNLSHTFLGLFNVKTSVYNPAYDLGK